jgi:ABC-type branched-subunit amino acid transport system substrate-binding protein/cell division protein FtsL
MTSKTSITFLVLALAGMLVSAGGSYYYISSQLNPVIRELETKMSENLLEIQELNSSLLGSIERSVSQNNTISELEDAIQSYETQIEDYQKQVDELLRVNNDTKQALDKYRKLSKEFYKMHPIKIGITASTASDEPYTRYVSEKAEQDIHRYCLENDLPYRFDFVLGNNLGTSEMALGNVITFDSLSIDLVVGHLWDSHCSASLNYVNDNDMLLLSPGSSSYELAHSDDNLFRLAPIETQQLDVNIECMKMMGIEHVIVFAIKTDWGRMMSESFEEKLSGTGIELVKVLYYPESPKILNPQIIYLSDLVFNLTRHYGDEHVALQLFDNGRLNEVFESGGGYSEDIIWFGTGDIVYAKHGGSRALLNVLLLSPVPTSTSSKFSEFSREILDNYGFNVSYYGASAYDACWLYALSIMEAGSTNVTMVRRAILNVSDNYIGVSGDCSLNGFGDRVRSDYNIMGFSRVGDNFIVFGEYNSTQKTVEFDIIHPKIP